MFEIKYYLLQLKEIIPLFKLINSQTDYGGIAFQDTEQALQLLDPEKNNIATFHISSRFSSDLTRIRSQKREIEEKMRHFNFKDIPKDLLEQRQMLVEQEQQEEQNVCAELTQKLRPFVMPLLENAAMIVELDVLMEKAAIAGTYRTSKPLISKDLVSFADMQNPQIAALLQKQSKEFTSITIKLQKGATVITGANMGGKSVALITTALNIMLIHYGFYPFAAKAAIPLFDYLHLLSGNLESQEHGLSSFGGELIGFKRIIEDINRGFSCILIDEFAHGTNPEEGAAIVQGITEYLNKCSAVTLLTTHYDKVSKYANAHYQIAGLQQFDMELLKKETDSLDNDEKLRRISRYMNYNLVMADNNQKPPKEALNICYLLGIPQGIIAMIERKMNHFT